MKTKGRPKTLTRELETLIKTSELHLRKQEEIISKSIVMHEKLNRTIQDYLRYIITKEG